MIVELIVERINSRFSSRENKGFFEECGVTYDALNEVGKIGYATNLIDYSCIYEEASAMEQGFAIFANVIEMDDSGNVLNEKEAEYRAAQYIRQYVDREYTAEPPFEDWEVHLY